MNFLEKLDFLMDKYGLNKRTLSHKSDIPYTTIDNWYKRGYEGLKLTTLCKLNEFFNTTLDYWILDDITDPNYGKASGFEVDYDEMEHIKKYRSLDHYGQETVNYILDRECFIAKQQKEQPKAVSQNPVSKKPAIRYIQYYQRLASAGPGEYLFDNVPIDEIVVPLTSEAKNADFAIGINGDSMMPTYNDGDIVLVKKCTEIPQEGKVGIFVIDNTVVIKRVYEDALRPDNPLRKSIEYNGVSRIDCIGLVLGKTKKLDPTKTYNSLLDTMSETEREDMSLALADIEVAENAM